MTVCDPEVQSRVILWSGNCALVTQSNAGLVTPKSYPTGEFEQEVCSGDTTTKHATCSIERHKRVLLHEPAS